MASSETKRAGSKAAGAKTMQQTQHSMPVEEMTNDQVVSEAERVHKHSTLLAIEARKAAKSVLQQQEAAEEELDDQNRRLDKVDNRLTQTNQELTYAEKLMQYMRRCCCCWMCDSCTGADPGDRVPRGWETNAGKGRSRKPEKSRQAQANGVALAGRPKTATVAHTDNYRDPYIKLSDEHEAAEMRMHQETRKQNEILDEIHQDSGQALKNAKRLLSKVQESEQKVDALIPRVDDTIARVKADARQARNL